MHTRKLKLQIVTAITFSRIPLVMLFLLTAVIYNQERTPWLFWLALACLILASLTDAFDGLLARKFNVETRMGAYADPLMDKMFYLVTLPTLLFVAAKNGHIMHARFLLIFCVLFLLRDQWISFLRSIGSLHNADARATWSGKLRTGLAFPLICAVYIHEESPYPLVGPVLLYTIEAIGFAINLMTLYIYTRNYWPYLKKSMQPDAK